MIDRGIARAKPLVAQWYRGTARPALDAQRAKIAKRRTRRRNLKSITVAESSPTKPGAEVSTSHDAASPDMSRAEAGARYLAALASRAYSDEQMRLVSVANIVDSEGAGSGVAELERSLAELPPAEVRTLLERMVADPPMFSEETLAELASILGRRDRLAIEVPRELR